MANKSQFRIGDRVRCVRDRDGSCVVGEVGTVVDFTSSYVGVNFDKHIGGHSMSGKARAGHGWYLLEDELELLTIKNPKIVITFNEKETTAKLFEGKRVLLTATAKCSEDDRFDPVVGAQVALQRLAIKQNSKLVMNFSALKDAVEII